jgi:hypothetical protein
MPGVLQIILYASQENRQPTARPDDGNHRPSSSSLPQCWSLPAVIISDSLLALGKFGHPIILHSRVASALGVENGEFVSFSLQDFSNDGYLSHQPANDNPHYSGRENDRFRLQVSIDPNAAFDVALETDTTRTQHLFGGVMHNNVGNFLMLTANGSMLKLSEQQRIFRDISNTTHNIHSRSNKGMDLKCSGMLLQVEGVTDYYNHREDGAGSGFCIYASTPLSNPKPSECLVQGYRYLGKTTNPHEAAYYGFLEALLWVFRLGFQTVWMIGSDEQVFRQVSTDSMNLIESTPTMQQLHRQVQTLLDRARKRRIQFKFLTTSSSGTNNANGAMDLATRAIMQQRNETWCHWSTINYQSQRSLPFNQAMARQVSI